MQVALLKCVLRRSNFMTSDETPSNDHIRDLIGYGRALISKRLTRNLFAASYARHCLRFEFYQLGVPLGGHDQLGGEQALVLILGNVGAVDDVGNELRAEG